MIHVFVEFVYNSKWTIENTQTKMMFHIEQSWYSSCEKWKKCQKRQKIHHFDEKIQTRFMASIVFWHDERSILYQKRYVLIEKNQSRYFHIIKNVSTAFKRKSKMKWSRSLTNKTYILKTKKTNNKKQIQKRAKK